MVPWIYIVSSRKPFRILHIILGVYEEVSSSNLCEHSSGGVAFGCLGIKMSNCQQDCENLSSCVGYSVLLHSCFQTRCLCSLYTSEDSCPFGLNTHSIAFSLDGNASIATTSSELVSGSAFPGIGNCFRKSSMYQIYQG